MNTDIRELALDTLHNRRLKASKSCLVSNEAGSDLQQCGAEAIPVIEKLIHEFVEPAMAKHVETHGATDPNAMVREGLPFAGLDHLLGAYWIICSHINPTEAVAFMGTTTEAVRSESAYQLAVFFKPSHSIAGIELPHEYAEFLFALRDSANIEMSDIASYSIKKLSINESVDR